MAGTTGQNSSLPSVRLRDTGRNNATQPFVGCCVKRRYDIRMLAEMSDVPPSRTALETMWGGRVRTALSRYQSAEEYWRKAVEVWKDVPPQDGGSLSAERFRKSAR